MKPEAALAAEVSRLHVRRAAFEDVPAVLRLMREAIEGACGSHYGPAQRRAVFLSYAQSLFVDVIRPYDSILAEAGGQTIGFAQLDPSSGRVRALFVSGAAQKRGLGRALLECLERLARAYGRRRLHGAMSLNAVGFYQRSGFRECPGPHRLALPDAAVPVLPMEKDLSERSPYASASGRTEPTPR